MKKILMSLLIVTSAGLYAIANTSSNKVEFVEYVVQKEVKTKIKMDKLPEVVQKAFKDSDYATYKLEEIFEVTKKDKEGKESKHYEFMILNGSEKWAISYSKDGKFLDQVKLDSVR